MAVRLQRRLFTVGEYDRMVQAGVFLEDDRVELIAGEIVEMAPIGILSRILLSSDHVPTSTPPDIQGRGIFCSW